MNSTQEDNRDGTLINIVYVGNDLRDGRPPIVGERYDLVLANTENLRRNIRGVQLRQDDHPAGWLSISSSSPSSAPSSSYSSSPSSAPSSSYPSSPSSAPCSSYPSCFVVDGEEGSHLDKCGEEFHLAMMLFVTSADLSTAQYEALIEVLALATPDTLHSLPKSIKTLQQRCRRSFPLMSLKGSLVEVDLRQIPPKKETPRHAYYFEPSEYCKIWLSSKDIRNSIHQGLGEYADISSEFWHGDAWMESIRTTSGQFAFVPGGPGGGGAPGTSTYLPLMPSDCVKYINAEGKVSMGRVKCVGMDKRQGRTQQPCATINPLIPPNELRTSWAPPEDMVDPFPEYEWVESDLPELILVETYREIVPCTSITSQIWVHFTDYASVDELRSSLLPNPPTYCVRLIAYTWNREWYIRPVHKRHRVLAELELKELTRNYVLQHMVEYPVHASGSSGVGSGTGGNLRRISIPYSIFLDGFGLYRNAYYSLKGMYITPAGMNLSERTRLYNMNVLMIGPFGSNEQQMAACLQRDAIPIGKGVKMVLDSGEEVFVTAFPLVLNGDMPQQNQNSGAKTHKAIYGCRSCFVSESQRRELNYNIHHYGRYMQHVRFIWQGALASSTKQKRDTALRRAGLTESGPFFSECYTMMDPQRGTPNDPMHAELRLCKYFEEALLEGILSNNGVKAYLAAWNIVQVPYGWGQPQNPVTHKGSMVFNEHGRISIINPFVLMHMFTNDDWAYHSDPATIEEERSSYIKGVARTRLIVEFGEMFTAEIVKTAWLLARCVTLSLQEVISTRERSEFKAVVIEKLFACASADTKTFKNYANVPNIHLALHYYEDIQNYGTARNSSTMMGEQKHKVFKAHAQHTNTKDNDLQLMKATNTAQTIRFLLTGAFNASCPDLAGQMWSNVQKCPTMCGRFIGAKAASDYAARGPESGINPSGPVWTGIDLEKSLFLKVHTGRALAINKINSQDHIHDKDNLCDSYRQCYDVDLLPHIRYKIRYWMYFAGMPKDDKHRGHVKGFNIKVNQIIKLRDDPYAFYHVSRIFTIIVGDMTRVFFVTKPMEGIQDYSSAPVYKIFRLATEAAEVTIGITSIDCNIMHFVSKGPNIWWYNPYNPNFT
ncbi:hypothetical protein DFP73DRAFT_529914 [Morchella snyderi]|nr:hypothetical protein DFP73DRAFT_529914 [Morchella snyderi]